MVYVFLGAGVDLFQVFRVKKYACQGVVQFMGQSGSKGSQHHELVGM